MKLDVRHNVHPEDSMFYDTGTLRERYLVDKVFEKDEVLLTYTHVDRLIFGGVAPVENELEIGKVEQLKTAFFLERREMGVINIGGEGAVSCDGQEFKLLPKEGLYVGMGTKSVVFKSADKANPSKFYIASAPAHRAYPIKHITLELTDPSPLGEQKTCNKRTLRKYINPSILPTCQLQMGMTTLEEGNVWNSMPCHTHERRMEAYMYFGLSEDNVVFHMMGEPGETRHIVMKNEQAVISPSWSIHCGCGTSAYTFIWSMCGENQIYDDMDTVKTKDLL